MRRCCRPTCASCAAWSTARTCRSTSRARCCRTIRRSRRCARRSPAACSASWRPSPRRTAETFGKIWEAFGAVLKEGLYEDHERREQLLALARFTTTTGTLRSLKQYVADLKPNQTEIYYLAGDSVERLKSNPKLEAARARGIEVLLLTDPVDAFWTAMPPDFEGKPLKSLSQGEVDFGLVPLLEEPPADETKPASAAVDDAMVIAAVKAALGERVSDVRASQRLTDSAACLVAGGQGPDRELERLLARQSRRRHQADPRAQHAPPAGARAGRRQDRARATTTSPISRRCCSTRRRSSTARCRTTRPRSRRG